MDMVVCPHCKSNRLVATRIPKDVIAVMPCPSCQELAVLFRNKVIALSRSILEQGSFEERKMHLAHVIAEFLEAGVLPTRSEWVADEGDGADADAGFDPFKSLRPRRKSRRKQDDETRDPISQEEVERFTRIELKRLDNATYFRRHFG